MKYLKILMLFCIGTYMMSATASAQANPYIQVLPTNSGVVAVGSQIDLIITVGNTGVGSIPVSKLRPIVQVSPTVVFLANAQQTGLPPGWTILSNIGDQLRLCNSGDVIPGQTIRTIILKVQGVTVTPPATFSGIINFGNGTTCAAGTSVAGDVLADNAATSTIEVIPVAACALAASASAGTISCNGGSTTLTASVTGAIGTIEYSINGGTTFQTGNTFTVTAGTYTVTAREVANTTCTANATPVVVAQPSLISASASASPILCNGGTTTLTITASGGSGTLQYSLNGGAYQAGNTFTVNAAGAPYTATVRDANLCTVSTTPITSISQPSAIAFSGSVTTPITVLTGTITVAATGGTGTKTYTITSGPTINTTGATSGVFTSLTAGTYVLTATDANGCTATTSVVLAPAAPCVIAVSAAAGSILCNGGTTTITATATGAVGAVQYSINGGAFQTANTFTVNAAGSPYIVTAQEVNRITCTATSSSIVVTQPVILAASASVTTPIATAGGTGTITVSATGGTGAKTFVISSGATINTTGATSGVFTGLLAGSYSFTVTDANGCTATTSVPLPQPGILIADPAVGQMFFTNTSNVLQSANILLFPPVYRLKVPFFNLNQTNIIPNGTIQLKVSLGSKLNLDPAFTLATAPLSNYFAWTSAIVVDSLVITGTQIADIPADFDDILVFNVKGKLSCTGNVRSRILIVNTLATLVDEDFQNNNATLQYTLPVTVTTTQVNVTCNGANNGVINVLASPGATVVIRDSSNVIVSNTGLPPGVYTVTATAIGDAPLSNSCSNSVLVTIVQPLVLTTATSGVVNNLCNGGNTGSFIASSSGGTSPYTYVISGPTVNTTGATTGIFTLLLAGTYTVTATDANGCTATSTAVVGQPTGTAPDVSLGSDISGTLFATTGVSKTIVYNVTEIAGNPAVGDTIRITNPSGFTINFNSALASSTIGSTTYVLDNSRWKIDNSNPAFTSIILTDPGNAANPGTLLCNQRLNVSVTITRNTSNISTFTLSARFRRANGELNLNNNLNSIIFTAE